MDAQQFLQVVGPLPEPTLLLTAAGRVLAGNPALLTRLGIDPARLAGRDLTESVNDPPTAVREYLRQCARSRAPVPGAITFKGEGPVCCRADGYLLAPAAPDREALLAIRLAEKESAVAEFVALNLRVEELNREVARRKLAEEALRDEGRRKNEFLATLAHELRNPLAPIRTGMQLLKMAGGDPAAASEALGVMDRQLGQMVRLIDDLMDVSRITRDKLSLRKQAVGLGSVLSAALEASLPLIEAAGHRLTVDLPAGPANLEADPARLQQVFANLLNNAAKYTEPGGRIHLSARLEGGRAVVSVADTGIGIRPEWLASVFDMFTQADAAPGGSVSGLGIGLTLARRLAEMHGGEVEARSDGPGKGSEFIVRLPLAESAAAPPEPPADALPAAAGLRVLVADDNRDAADGLAKVLARLGHLVAVAYDGQQAVEVAEQFRPEVAVLDIGMPRLNGHDAGRRLRLAPWAGNLLLIALTGWGQEEDRERSSAAGFDRHLVKPVEPADVHRLISGLRPVATSPR